MVHEVTEKLIKKFTKNKKEFIDFENSFVFTFLKNKEIEKFKKQLSNISPEKRQALINSCFMLDFAKRIEDKHCPGIKFVLVFTAIESIMGNSNYEDFQSWIKKIKNDDCRINDEGFENSIKKLTEEYNKKFGVIRHVKEFFKKYLSIEDKKIIVSSVYLEKKINKKKELAPFCFICREKCFGSNPYLCLKEKNLDCKMNSLELDNFLDKTIGLLYDFFRNNFIHSGARSNFIENKENLISVTFKYKKNKFYKRLDIKNPLNFDKFYEIVFNGIKKYVEIEIQK